MTRPPQGDRITSRSNPLIRDIQALRRSPRRRRERGTTLVEGFKVLALAMDTGHLPVVLLFDEDRVNDEDRALVERARSLGATVRSVSAGALSAASVREGPMGCVASVHLSELPLTAVEPGPNPLVLVTEGVEKPGNLGALARTASAAGADALLAVDSGTDIFAPATVHASLGSVFQLPVVRCTSAEAIEWLRDRAIEIVATSPSAHLAYFEIDLAGPVALAVGNEHRGLSEPWLEAGTLALIPMQGPMNSLNATTAGGIVLFEAVRQRMAAPG